MLRAGDDGRSADITCSDQQAQLSRQDEYHCEIRDCPMSRSPLENPEIRKLFSELAPVLIAESDRGAVLIGTAHVDEHLKEMFHSLMPAGMPKADKRKLLRYSGALGSLGSRIDIAYSTRLINQNLYASLNTLRKVRNDAAHAAEPFDLKTQEHRICKLYDLGPGVSGFVNRSSLELLLQIKTDAMLCMKDEINGEPCFKTPQEVINYISSSEELLHIFQEQALRLELAIGICIICALLLCIRDDHRALLGDISTVSSLTRKDEMPSDRQA
jgi:hypothetical protein